MIEKMKFISITGPNDDIDRVINQYLSKYEIHLENPMLELESAGNLTPYVESNPYKDLLGKCEQLKKHLPKDVNTAPAELNVPVSEQLVTTLFNKIEEYEKKISIILHRKETLQTDYDKIKPFIDLEYDIEDILGFKNIKYRFGRIPIEHFSKFEMYVESDETSIFTKCATDKEYVWGVYFVSSPEASKCDAAYTSLHFERTFIPETSKGTPKEACDTLQKQMDKCDYHIDSIHTLIENELSDKASSLYGASIALQGAYENFDVRKMATHTVTEGNIFYIICGWMTEKETDAFMEEIKDDDNVVCIVEDRGVGSKKTPPTKLKNPAIFKPFEMYIRMYGLPSYNEIDPTIFVALTYSFIFGAMFGDVGQGLLLTIGGFLLYKLKKMNLAAIISSAGIFSTFFGFMFGSVFGFEDWIDAVWLRPVDAMTDVPFIGKLNTVFVIAIGFGMFLILITMVLHIINGIKNHDTENIFFDTNALAGLVFYGSIVAVVGLLMTGQTLPAGIVLGVMFGIPLLVIALTEPLTHWLTKTKPEEKTGIGMFITQTFFELFEVLLSYFSNTLSFIRIGAFAVSHVSMMEVVLMLAGAESGSPNWVVVVLGNLFVCGMEGLIVGIQVLRLEYYELFSRFYKGTGREFKPFKVHK